MITTIPTEKPSQAAIIAKILGATPQENRNYYVAQTNSETIYIVPLRGHVMDVPGLSKQSDFADLDIKNEKWFAKKGEIVNHPKFPFFPKPLQSYPRSVSGESDYQRRYNTLVKYAKAADRIILATDPDYEGAALAYNVLYSCHCEKKVTASVNMQSTSTATIKKNLRAAFMERPAGDEVRYDKILATIGIIRRDIDYAIGINGTIFASAHADGFFPFGTQKARLMWEIIKRNNQIKGFDTRKYYLVKATTTEGYEFFYAPEDKEERFDRKAVEAVFKKVQGLKNLQIKSLTTKKAVKKSPQWFDGITLGQMGAKALKKKLEVMMSRTSGILQNMYQKQVLGYPGTEGRIMPIEEFEKYSAIAQSFSGLYPDQPYDFSLEKKHLWAREPVEQNHIPLSIVSKKPFVDKVSLTPDEQKVLDIAIKQLLTVFLPDATTENLTATTNLSAFPFAYKELYDVDIGWQALYNNKPKQRIFAASQGDALEIASVEMFEKETEPPRPYTENAGTDSLATMMKKKGIGTDNTIPHLIKNVFEQEYVYADEKKKVWPTEKGELLWKTMLPPEALSEILDRFKNEIIPALEKRKISIEEAMAKRDEIIKASWRVLESKQEELEKTKGIFLQASRGGKQAKELGRCPACKHGTVTFRQGTSKKNNKEYAFYGCSNYKECDFSIQKKSRVGYGEVTLTETAVQKMLKNPGVSVKVTLIFKDKKTDETKRKKIDCYVKGTRNDYKQYTNYVF